MGNIAANIKGIIHKIKLAAERVGRKEESVELVAVTKTVDVSKIKEAIRAGIKIIGENRVQEAREKFKDIGKEVEWHLIGHLQTNKVKYIFDIFSLIHSVDSLLLSEEIQRRAENKGLETDILIEVNLSGEKTKFGILPEKAINFVKDISRFKNINIMGLMTIPPFSESPEDSRKYFKMLRMLRDDIQKEGIEMKELSMGMSNDFEAAVEEGATMVRIGTAIFGERR
ncbi:MAG: YggS family pyridoxal phosphate enzyme [Nitrospinae bacterium RIFCSPLOWO2_12_39_16]|nr:MAG: YggS family pyridoxal phosphate enzyme [Nitrospinae bacterium RIFCSPLOWO2_12_39_16]